MSWINNYHYELPKAPQFDVVDGLHEILIKEMVLKRNKDGTKNMIELTLAVAGAKGIDYKEYFVEGEYFDQKISRVFDAFDIPEGNWNRNDWINRRGAATFGHKEEKYRDKQNVEKIANKCYLVEFMCRPEKKQQIESLMQQKNQNCYQPNNGYNSQQNLNFQNLTN